MLRGLSIQIQVIHALILRELKSQFGNTKLGYIWALLEPVAMVSVFAVMFRFMGRVPVATMGILPFLVSGFTSFRLFTGSMGRAVSAIDANRQLLYYPRVRPIDLVFGRLILEFATTMCVIAILLTAAVTIEGDRLRPNIVLVAVAEVLLCLLGGGFGLVLCGLGVFWPTLLRIYGYAMRPLFFGSALFFSTNSMPTKVRHVLLKNPILHGIELCREGLYPNYHVEGVTPWYPALFVLVFWFFGLTLERVARRHTALT